MARKVLLADDSVTAQNMGRRILSDAGYDVTTVNNGSAALKKIAESKPDLIVLDVYMPGYGGLEVCQRIRATSTLPIIVLSVKDAERDKVLALDLGADDYVPKPFGMDEVLARIRVALRHTAQAEAETPLAFLPDAAALADRRRRRRDHARERLARGLANRPPHCLANRLANSLTLLRRRAQHRVGHRLRNRALQPASAPRRLPAQRCQ